tara:strand:- start:442 stop:585 length:144 start_codon:yes stop_codon:yes gene_type:complete
MSLKDDFCKGCGRSLNQISNWSNYNDEEKKDIIKNLKKNNFTKNTSQ